MAAALVEPTMTTQPVAVLGRVTPRPNAPVRKRVVQASVKCRGRAREVKSERADAPAARYAGSR
jgi:hypothetical protein